MQCPKCNYKNAGGADMCMLCGEALAEKPRTAEADAPVAAGAVDVIYLHCFVRDPLKVTKESPATIGRVDGNDIVLPAKIVSRRHCRVEWKDNGFFAIDNGSSNGMYINEQKTGAAPIGPGDEIRIGSFIIHCTASIENEKAEMDASATMVVSPVGSDSTTGFAGKIEEMGLGEIATIVEMTRKTGTLVLHFKTGLAKIFFKDGQVINAEGLGKKAEEAFFEIFFQTEGTFEFEQGTPLVKRVIEMPTTSLLLEAARMSDEANR